MPRAKKGLYKVQIFKKTTGPCLSRSYYSMPPCLGCLSISVWVRAWWAGSRWNGKCCGTAGWRWWSRRCSTAGYTTPSRQKGKHLMVMARKYLNFGGKIIKNLAGKVCFNLLSTVEVKQIILCFLQNKYIFWHYKYVVYFSFVSTLKIGMILIFDCKYLFMWLSAVRIISNFEILFYFIYKSSGSGEYFLWYSVGGSREVRKLGWYTVRQFNWWR